MSSRPLNSFSMAATFAWMRAATSLASSSSASDCSEPENRRSACSGWRRSWLAAASSCDLARLAFSARRPRGLGLGLLHLQRGQQPAVLEADRETLLQLAVLHPAEPEQDRRIADRGHAQDVVGVLPDQQEPQHHQAEDRADEGVEAARVVGVARHAAAGDAVEAAERQRHGDRLAQVHEQEGGRAPDQARDQHVEGVQAAPRAPAASRRRPPGSAGSAPPATGGRPGSRAAPPARRRSRVQGWNGAWVAHM